MRYDAFGRIADQWCFDHVTSSPNNPQSNGHIEWHVQTVKRMLKKGGVRYDVHIALLVLMATPIDSHLPSTAELLYGSKNNVYSECQWHEMRNSHHLGQRQATSKERHDARGVTQIWQNSHNDMSVHAPRSLRDDILAVLLTNADNHVPIRSNQPVEEYCRGTDVTAKQQRWR